MAERFLVTGCMGCLGAWTVKHLLDEGVDVVGFDLSTDDRRLRLLLDEDGLESVHLVQGDLGDTDVVRSVVGDLGVTHVVHLAALQVPFCKADPVAGATVNVVGTVNVFEAALAHRDTVEGLSYASSVAVFGPSALYDGMARDDDPAAPATLYGVYKHADEGVARVYALDHQLGSVGLRPHTVYGPGRDQGLTSSATVAMVAAAAGEPYHVSHGGACTFQHASDVAGAFVAAARASGTDAAVVNMGGPSASVAEVIEAIEQAAPEVKGRLSFEDFELPFPPALADDGLQRLLGGFAYTGLEEGVAWSVEQFRALLADGKVRPPSATGGA
jgi:UDP-glucuronate 4-epimerase